MTDKGVGGVSSAWTVSGSQLTLSMWINPSVALVRCVAHVSFLLLFNVFVFLICQGRLVSKADGTADQNHWLMLSILTGGDLRFRLRLDQDGQPVRTILLLFTLNF